MNKLMASANAATKEPVIPGFILRGEIESTIAAMGGGKIPVRFVGEDALVIYDSPRAMPRVQIPALSSTEQYPLEQALILRGYANHETGHIRYSDIPYIWAFAKKRLSPPLAAIFGVPNSKAQINTPAERAALGISEKEFWTWKTFNLIDNAIEDWRLERELKKEFPGSFINIGKTREHINNRQAGELAEAKQLPMPNAFGSMVTWAGCIANGYPCSPVAQLNLDRASELCPDGRQMLDAYWPRVLQLHTHRDVMDLAFDIAVECADLYYKDPQQPQQQNKDAGQKSQPQNGGQPKDPQDGSGQGPSDTSSPGAGDPRPGSDDTTSSQSDGKDQKQDSANATGGSDPAQQNGADANSPPQSGQSQKPDDADGQSPADAGQNADGAGGDQPDNTQAGNGGQSADQQPCDGTDGNGADQPDGSSNSPTSQAGAPQDSAQAGAGPQSQPAPNSGPDTTGSADASGQKGKAPSGGQAGSSSNGPGSNGAQPAPPRSPSLGADDIDTDTLDVGDVISQIVQQTGDNEDEDDQSFVKVEVSSERDIASYHRLIASGGAASARVAQATRKIFMSETYRRERFQLEDGELDLSNLIGISTGSADIYSRRDARRDRAAAVCFNFDLSSSMLDARNGGKRRLDHLAEAAAVLASAIGTDRDIHTAALTYTSLPEEHLIKWIKRFSDPPSALKAAIGAIPADSDNGGTPTHFGLLEAQKALRLRTEKRKILILITDGEASDPERTLQAAHGVMRAGILLVGIGIGPNAPAMAIPGWTRIKDTSELGPKLTEIVSSVLQQHKWVA